MLWISDAASLSNFILSLIDLDSLNKSQHDACIANNTIPQTVREEFKVVII